MSNHSDSGCLCDFSQASGATMTLEDSLGIRSPSFLEAVEGQCYQLEHPLVHWLSYKENLGIVWDSGFGCIPREGLPRLCRASIF